jgi:hypothetical protein
LNFQPALGEELVGVTNKLHLITFFIRAAEKTFVISAGFLCIANTESSRISQI